MYALDTSRSVLKIPELEAKNSFLTINSGLWKALGDLDQTLFVQQIWYWLSNPSNGFESDDGQRWIWKSIKEFKIEVFPGWSETKIRKVRDALCDREILLRANKFSEHYRDRQFCQNRTLYYRLNLDKLAGLINRVLIGKENKGETAETIETVRSAHGCEPVPRLSVEHNKEYITKNTKEKINIESQAQSKFSKNPLKSTLAFVSNSKAIATQKQQDLSQAFHEEKTAPSPVKICNEQNISSKSMLEKPEIRKKQSRPVSVEQASDISDSQPDINRVNKAVKLKSRKMYQNYNNPAESASKDDVNDPELVGRKYNYQKGTYGSRSNDPWMQSRNAINTGFVEWLYKTREQQGQDCSLANLKAEIRNNYVRAEDLWQDYLFAASQDLGKSNAKFGSPRHEITAESMDAWIEETRTRIDSKRTSQDAVNWESKLEEKAEVQRQREECRSLVEKRRLEAEAEAQSVLKAKLTSAKEADLSKIKQLEELQIKHPELNLNAEIVKIKARINQNV